jgi:hypothetical protein
VSAIEFRAVRCPRCRTVAGEIATGFARFKCPGCKKRVWAGCDGVQVRVLMADAPAARVG